MSRNLRRVGIALMCSALLVWCLAAPAFAASKPPSGVVPLVNPPNPANCIGLTIAVSAYEVDAWFHGSVTNVCGDGVSVHLTANFQLVCSGTATNLPTKRADFGLLDRGSTTYSYTVEGTCLVCTNHVITSAPPFYLKADISAYGITAHDYPVSSAPAHALSTARLTNDQTLLGSPC